MEDCPRPSGRNPSPLCCSVSMEDLSILNHNYEGSNLLSPGLICSKLPPSILAHNLLLHQRSYSDSVFHMPTHAESRLDAIRKLRGDDKENFDDENETIFRLEIPEVTLVDEITAKYGCEQGFYSPHSHNVIFGKTSPVKQLPGKRGVSGCLELLVLNERAIACTGDVHKLRPLVEHVTELDLAKNRISDWKEILCALSVMPNVYHCNLSLNPLSSLAVPATGPLPNMSRLVLNGTGIKWGALTQLIKYMPNLEELHLSLNNLCSDPVPCNGEVHSCVTTLHVSLCDIADWNKLSAICKLFPNLYTLTAADNPIEILDETCDISCLSLVRRLNLNRCAFTSWPMFDVLAAVPHLVDLRLTAVPLLCDMNEDERRMHVLARLPGLTSFNGSCITEDIRTDAERAFIRYCNSNATTHHRLAELEGKHGEVWPLVEVDFTPKKHVNVVVVFDDTKFPLCINLTHTIGQLKKLVGGMVELPVNQFDLFHVDKEIEDDSSLHMTRLRYNRIALHSLKIKEDDELHVLRKVCTTRLNAK